MTVPDQILTAIVSSFIKSAERDSFNGIIAASLLRIEDDQKCLRSYIAALVDTSKVNCVFASTNVNMHIKRFPDQPIDKQKSLLKTEGLNAFCIYPTGPEIARNVDITHWNDRPFSKLLTLAEPQLNFRAFDMGVLERYTSDPRYTVDFEDYAGRMSIMDESFVNEGFPERDQVSLQTFGLGFDQQRTPHVVVFLRYLADLSPAHQQYWNSYLVVDNVRMCKQYYQSSILGEFWKNRSIRYAIIEEMALINSMSKAIWGNPLFRDSQTGDIPIGLSSFLRPTAANYNHFVIALDKLLSESIDITFFDGKVPRETETFRADGKVEIKPKGSISLLEEWLLAEIIWEDVEEFNKVVIAPLRKIRRLRQKPAHTFTEDHFSNEYYDKRKGLLWDVFNCLSNIRRTFAKHAKAGGIKSPSWLDDEEIDVF